MILFLMEDDEISLVMVSQKNLSNPLISLDDKNWHYILKRKKSNYRAALPLHISLSAFISRKRGNPYPHWISGDAVVPTDRTSLRWTGTKAEAVEIIYELVHVGVLNNGRATIMQVTRWFEQEFQIELGNVSKIFQDIRNCKKETTSLAVKMDKALRQYIEQLDEEDLEKNNQAKRA